MDFVPSFFSWSGFALTLGFVLGSIVAFTLAARSDKYSLLMVGGVVCALAALCAFLGQMQSFDDRRADAVAAEVADAYGVSLTYNEAMDLEYPKAEPEGDFKVYGSTETRLRTEKGYTTEEVSLIWDQNRLVLASSTDGENFEFLERRD